jgi:hypothetical protein
MVLHRFNLVVGIVWLFTVHVASPVAAQNPTESKPAAAPSVAPAEIDAWIAKLDHDRYRVREEATQRLFEAGAAALDQLLAVADSERPEPAERAIWILRRQSIAKDPALRRKALEHLAKLKKSPQVAAAARQQLAEIEHQEAVDTMEDLGARYLSAGEVVAQLGSNYACRLILDERWHGKDADLAKLRHVIGLRHVIIIGTDISFEGVKELQHCGSLQELWLYGTKLTPDDVIKVRKLLPEVMIDYRQGALLGVASNSQDALGPAVVTRVELGSAAAAAGVQQGDIIQKFDGEAIPNFKTLTQKVGAHHPGDEIMLGIVRNGAPLDLKVKLGKWKTIEAD